MRLARPLCVRLVESARGAPGAHEGSTAGSTRKVRHDTKHIANRGPVWEVSLLSKGQEMTREQVASALEQEISKLVNAQASDVAPDRLLSQVINSVGFLQLIATMENRLGVTIDDEAVYEAGPVTIGDLADFLFSLVSQRSPA